MATFAAGGEKRALEDPEDIKAKWAKEKRAEPCWGSTATAEQEQEKERFTQQREEQIEEQKARAFEAAIAARERSISMQTRGPSTATTRGPSTATTRGPSTATSRGPSSSTARGFSESTARGHSSSTTRASMSQDRSFSKAPSQARRNWAQSAWDNLDGKMQVDDDGRGRSYSTVRGGSASQMREPTQSRQRSESRGGIPKDVDFMHFLQFVDAEEQRRRSAQNPNMPDVPAEAKRLGVAGAPVMRPPPKAPELASPMQPLFDVAKLSKEELLAKIKAGRKAGGVFAERWKRFCDSNAKRRQGDEGTRDPTRHGASFLGQALLFCQGLPMQDKLEADKEEADIEWERMREIERLKYNDFRARLNAATGEDGEGGGGGGKGGGGDDALQQRGDLLAQRPSDGVGWLRRDDGDWVFHAPRVEATCPKCKFTWKVLAEQAGRAPVVCPECGMQSWRRLSAAEQDLANVATHRRKMKPIMQAEGLKLMGMANDDPNAPQEDWVCNYCGFTNLAKYRAGACMMCRKVKSEDARRPMPGAGPVPKPKEGQSSTVAMKRIPAIEGAPAGM